MNAADSIAGRVDVNATQVFMLSSPASLPASFAPHHWFVLNRRGTLSRWEVLHRILSPATRWGYLYLNQFPPFEGLEIILPTRKYLWDATLLSVIDGAEANRAIEVIESSPRAYPYRDVYALTGPNSNTYSQWVLSHVPEFGVSLPWNAFGKNYPIVSG